MNPCCKQEDYEYVEVMYSNIKIHIKCTCKICFSYIAFVKREEVDEKLIKKLKTKPLF